MATNYPTSLDTGSTTLRTDITATTELDDVGFYHDEQHVNAHGAVIAVETKLGVGSSDASAAGAGTVLVHSGSGSTGWSAAATGVTSVGTLSSLTVSGDVTVDTDTLHVDSTNDRVGIGTTSPSQELDVAGSIVISVGNGVMFDRSGTDLDVLFKETPTSTTYGTGDDVVLRNPNGANIRFQTNGTNDRMLIDSAGNVGIGTTSPSYALDVSGSIRVNGPVLSDPSSANELRVTTAYGYIDIGPKNASYCHIYTDIAGGFYFNETISADGGSTIRGGLTVTGALTLSQDGQDVLNFSANDTNDNRGIAFNGRTALTADYNDGWLRLNNAGEFGNGIYTPGNFRAEGIIRIDSTRGITNVTGNYGTIQTNGGGVGGWEGYSVDGWVVFMANSSTGNFGIYDDTYNHWAIYGDFNAWVQLNYDNSARVQTSSAGVNIWKTLRLLNQGTTEGGEVQFDPGTSWTSGAGTYFIDMFQDAQRMFRSGGTGSYYLQFASGLPGTTAGSYLRISGNRLYYYSSVADIKEDMYDSGELLEYLNERNPIHSVRPHIFHMKPIDNGDGTFDNRGGTGNFLHGFIADDFADAIPEAQTADGSGNLGGFDDAAISSLLTAEMQRIVPMLEELYQAAHPDWVPPQPRPPERIENEKAIFEAYLVEEKAKWDETQAQIQEKHPGPSDPPPEAEIP